jgi:hypothetical protein
LHAFDAELRKELGVWYTPEEIVRYQVERVDRNGATHCCIGCLTAGIGQQLSRRRHVNVSLA